MKLIINSFVKLSQLIYVNVILLLIKVIFVSLKFILKMVKVIIIHWIDNDETDLFSPRFQFIQLKKYPLINFKVENSNN